MRRLTSTLLALALLAAESPADAQVTDSTAATDATAVDSTGFAGSYWTLGGLYYANNNDYDLMLFGGQAWPLGAGGGWTLRAGLGTGVSFYGLSDTGAMAGAQLGLERVLTGDRLELRSGQPLELYALLGGAAYAGWNLTPAQEGTALVPAASAGLGLRFRGTAASDPMLTLELYYEERFSDFDPRLFIRFDYMHPRGASRATPPERARP
ncbi:MAG TPA: hypothetical protein VF212_04640 [Longimicrobiales bacterium]